MTTLDFIKKRNNKSFSDRFVKRELKAMKRECRHLEKKASERRLTDWEAERLADIKQCFILMAERSIRASRILRLEVA